MDALSPLHRAYFAYLSRMYALAYRLNQRSLLGLRLSAIARWLPILALFVGWVMAWPPVVMIVLLVMALWINYSLWRARRNNYNRFVPNRATGDDAPEQTTLPPNERLPIQATGLFSVSGRESNLLLRPAKYWYVPLGDHIIMAEEEPGKFLYQFFDARSLQELREGLLLFGPHPRAALAVSFLARWGPEFTRFGRQHETDPVDLPPPRRVTVYLSAEDDAVRHLVRDTIISDARRARLSDTD